MRCGETGGVLVYNGELYNYKELREELHSRGHAFKTDGDTEVVLRALIEWGQLAVPRLNGMFALAFWDPRHEAGILARDRLGIKPLYIARGPSTGLSFASELEALHHLSPHAFVTLDPTWLHEYLHFGTGVGTRTAFEGVRSLAPGTVMEVRRGQVTEQTYWAPRLDAAIPTNEAVERVGTAIDSAVRRQVVSDVPLGVLLSGGLDSSLVAEAAARATSTLRTFHVVFRDDSGPSEAAAAAVVAARIGAIHEEVEVTAGDVAGSLVELTRRHGQPFADPANVPLLHVATALAGRVTVVLQGDGGDELFGGYDRYRSTRLVELLLRLPLARMGPLVRRMGPLRRFSRLQRGLIAASTTQRSDVLPRMITAHPLGSPTLGALTRPAREVVCATDPFADYAAFARGVHQPGITAAEHAMLVDLMVLLPSQMLEKVDRGTMARSLEARVPLLDNEVVDVALRLPFETKIRGATSKWVLRQLVSERLGRDVANLPKRGFTVPFGAWLRADLGSLFGDLMADQRVLRHQIIEVERARQLLQIAGNGGWVGSFQAYKLLLLALWLQQLPTSVELPSAP